MRARLVLTIAALGAASLIAGCATQSGGGAGTPTASPTPADNGVAALSANEILQKATTALKDQESIHMKGAGKEDGEAVEIDLKIKGDDVAGTVAAQGLTLEIVRVGADAYLKADKLWETLLAANPTALNLLKGKFLKFPATDPRFKEFTNFSNPEEILKPEGTVTKGATKTVNGKPAIGLTDDAKEKSTVWISTVGDPVPLRIEEDGTGNAVDFTYDEAITITAPATTEVIDITKVPNLPGF